MVWVEWGQVIRERQWNIKNTISKCGRDIKVGGSGKVTKRRATTNAVPSMFIRCHAIVVAIRLKLAKQQKSLRPCIYIQWHRNLVVGEAPIMVGLDFERPIYVARPLRPPPAVVFTRCGWQAGCLGGWVGRRSWSVGRSVGLPFISITPILSLSL